MLALIVAAMLHAQPITNPNCWPGAVYCAPMNTPEDPTVCFFDGQDWRSAYSQTYGVPCQWSQLGHVISRHGGHHHHNRQWWF